MNIKKSSVKGLLFLCASSFMHLGKSCREPRKAPLRWLTGIAPSTLLVIHSPTRHLDHVQNLSYTGKKKTRAPHFPQKFQFDTPVHPSAVHLEV